MDSDRVKTAEEVQQCIRALSSRDLQLWSIGLLILLVLATGFAALVAPNLMWENHALVISTRYLPQLFFGFIALIILFNVYVLAQRRELNTSRQELISELMFAQRVQNSSLLDPLTGIFNRRYLDYALPREIALANRHGEALVFLLFDLDGFSRVNSRFGQMTGDQLLIATARLLAGAFGASETLLRYGPDEFLVLIPECSREQAQERVCQVLGQVVLWNETAGKGYRMVLNYGSAEYRQGCDVQETLAAAESNLQRNRKESRKRLVRQLRPECLLISRPDDDARVLRQTLESLQVEVETCAEATTARDLLQQRRFEAILVDTNLPGADDLLSRVRELNSARNLILVALGSPAESARFGINFVLEKPLLPSKVTRTLRVVHTLMAAERQQYYRHPVSSAVVLQLNGEAECEGTATDLSEGGLAVRCAHTLQTGATGSIRLQLPETHTILAAHVQIAWADGEGRAGLRFLEMSRTARSALGRWLREHSENMVTGNSLFAETEVRKKAAGED